MRNVNLSLVVLLLMAAMLGFVMLVAPFFFTGCSPVENAILTRTEYVAYPEYVEVPVYYEEQCQDDTGDIIIEGGYADYHVQVSEVGPLLDVLLVVDGSGSMADDQPDVLTGTVYFLQELRQTPWLWRIGVIETDATASVSVWRTELSDVLADVSTALNYGWNEAGFDAVVNSLAVDDHRSDANLLVVFVSDEWPSGTVTEGWEYEYLVGLAKGSMDYRTIAVVGSPDLGCGYDAGAYLDVDDFRGVICHPDSWRSSTKVLKDLSAVSQTVFPLDYMPNVASIEVWVDAEPDYDWYYSTPDNAVVLLVTPEFESVVTIAYLLSE